MAARSPVTYPARSYAASSVPGGTDSMPRSSSTALNPLRSIHVASPSSSTVALLRSVAQQCRGGHHHIRPREQVFGHVGGVFDARGGRERGPHTAAQQRDPRLRQQRAVRAGERYRGHDGERFGVDIGLQEAVEKDEGVGAGLVQSQREIPNRAEVRAELDRDRDGDRAP